MGKGVTYDDIEQVMEAAVRDASADVGEEFSDDMVVDLASSVLIGQPYSLVREWCRRNLGFTPASLRPVRVPAGVGAQVARPAFCRFPVLHSEATRLARPLVCGCVS